MAGRRCRTRELRRVSAHELASLVSRSSTTRTRTSDSRWRNAARLPSSSQDHFPGATRACHGTVPHPRLCPNALDVDKLQPAAGSTTERRSLQLVAEVVAVDALDGV